MSSLSELVADLASGKVRVIDLTQPLGPDTPVIDLPPEFGASPGLTVKQISRYDDLGPAWYWNTISLGEHTGTHFDAPVHWITGKDLPNNTTDTLPVERFVGPASVIDKSEEAAADEDFLLTVQDVVDWEAQYGQIASGSWVLLRTDWSKREGAEAFLNARDDGPHTPGFHTDCAKFLAEERDILGVGVETVGTDAGQAGAWDPPFPTHTYMHGAGKLGLASLSNLDQLPAVGAVVIAAPLKLVNGSGSPVRVLAVVVSE